MKIRTKQAASHRLLASLVISGSMLATAYAAEPANPSPASASESGERFVADEQGHRQALLNTLGGTQLHDWLGNAVYEQTGNKLGTLRDFAIDLGTGQITHFLIEPEGMFAESRIAEIDFVYADQTADRIVLSLNHKPFDQLPTYDPVGPLSPAQPMATWGVSTVGGTAMIPPRPLQHDRIETSTGLLPEQTLFSGALANQPIYFGEGDEPIGSIIALIQPPSADQLIAVVDRSTEPDSGRIAIRVDLISVRDGKAVATDIDPSMVEQAPELGIHEKGDWNNFSGQPVARLTHLPASVAALE